VTIWEATIAFLASLSAEPGAVGEEHPRAAAACQAAYASMAVDAAPPAPGPKPGECCGDCKGTGFITHGDGHRTPCPCPATCKCKAKPGALPTCPDGKCRVPGASPASGSPAAH
jgi:hypothetical protein